MHYALAGKLTGPVAKWFVLAFWIITVLVAMTFAGKLHDVLNDESTSWLPSEAESTRALERMEAVQDPNSIPTVIVYEKKSGLAPADLQTLRGHAAEIAEMDGVEGEIIGPIPSEDGQAAQTVVTFNVGDDGWNDLIAIVDDLNEIVGSAEGIDAWVAGAGGNAADQISAFNGIDSTLLLAALGTVIIILLFVYRSPILWLLPILSAVFGLVTALGLVYFLAKDFGLTVNSQSQAILSILVIGAGTDYALLLVARYREELRRHEDRHEAMAFALHRAAPAILASASTVALGLLALSFAKMNSTAGMGPVVAVGVVVTFVVMVTLLPALLVITGRWVFWPKRPTNGSPEPTSTGIWSKVANFIKPRPRQVWIVVSALLAIACLGLLRMDANGLPSDEVFVGEADSVTGTQVLVDHGMFDPSNTVMVVANGDRAGAVKQAMAGVDGLEPADANVYGEVGIIEAVIDADISSQRAFDIVRETRSVVHAVDGADALVAGGSAFFLDTKLASERDNRVIVPIVLVIVLLVLMALLRSVVAPLLLLGTVVLSFGAALGLSWLVFEFIFDFPAVDPSFPLFTFVFLVALGIDYNIFLMTRVREEAIHLGTRRGAVVGLTTTGGVITSAGIVLAATFLVLGTLPLVALVQIGFTIALGVMLDTMIVRSILVTAINLDLEDKIWWPSALADGPTDPREPIDPTESREVAPTPA